MATQVQFRGGTTSEHSSFNGAAREVTVDTTKQTLVVQDGSTNGGFPLLREKNPDGQKVYFGTGNDLEIYHVGGGNTFINDTATAGQFIIQARNGIDLKHNQSNDIAVRTLEGESTYLYYDGALQVKTTSTGLNLADNKRIDFGTGADLKIHHDGTDNYWETGAQTTHFRVNNGNRLTINGTTGDVSMQGASGKNLVWDNSAAHLNLNDSAKATYGTGEDCHIFHDGTNMMIDNNSGELKISSTTLRLRADNGGCFNENQTETAIDWAVNGASRLYYDSVQKLTTSSTGIEVSGNVHVNDSDKLQCGNAADFKIYHDGTNTQVRNETGTLLTMSDTYDLRSWSSNETMIKGVLNAQVELYHNGSKKLETVSTGVKINGDASNINSACDDLIVGSSASGKNDGITIMSNSGQNGTIAFADQNASFQGAVGYVHNGDYLRFFAGGSLRARIDSDGLKFGDDSAAANALDDYEEGSWTPTIYGSTTAGSYSYEAVRTGGKYTKIGNMVYIEGVVRISAINTAGAGDLNIGGLPKPVAGFSQASSWNIGRGVQVHMYGTASNSTATNNPPPFVCVASGGSSAFNVRSYGKNYNVMPQIEDMDDQYWIYQIAGWYPVS